MHPIKCSFILSASAIPMLLWAFLPDQTRGSLQTSLSVFASLGSQTPLLSICYIKFSDAYTIPQEFIKRIGWMAKEQRAPSVPFCKGTSFLWSRKDWRARSSSKSDARPHLEVGAAAVRAGGIRRCVSAPAGGRRLSVINLSWVSTPAQVAMGLLYLRDRQVPGGSHPGLCKDAQRVRRSREKGEEGEGKEGKERISRGRDENFLPCFISYVE